jgi:RimJ/RimL family protein N-acetyltransferase
VIPRVETERLLMREFRGDDLDAYAEMYADPDVTRFLGGPADRRNAWLRMTLMAGHWVVRGYGNWALERRSDGRMIGRAGLWQPEGWPGLEVGWLLARHAWGHGYATEAARASREWARRELGAEELISIIEPDNWPSRRVAERIGMAVREERELNGKLVVIYAG